MTDERTYTIYVPDYSRSPGTGGGAGFTCRNDPTVRIYIEFAEIDWVAGITTSL